MKGIYSPIPNYSCGRQEETEVCQSTSRKKIVCAKKEEDYSISDQTAKHQDKYFKSGNCCEKHHDGKKKKRYCRHHRHYHCIAAAMRVLHGST
eukprot:9977618-Ditylum_brightwellii.AAC.1